MSFLAGIHVFKAFPAYTTTELDESALNVVRFDRVQENYTYNYKFRFHSRLSQAYLVCGFHSIEIK